MSILVMRFHSFVKLNIKINFPIHIKGKFYICITVHLITTEHFLYGFNLLQSYTFNQIYFLLK